MSGVPFYEDPYSLYESVKLVQYPHRTQRVASWRPRRHISNMSPQPSLEDETLSSPFTFRARPKSLPSYRSSKALPYELREHCIIYFEEALCTLDNPRCDLFN